MTKDELRRQIKAEIKKQKENNPDFVKEQSHRICNKILQSDSFKTAQIILAYMALSDEVDLSEVIKTALNQNKTVALPKIIPGTSIMEFYRISDLDKKSFISSKDSFYIEEPAKNPANLFTQNDFSAQSLILVPGRAFTKNGDRLGRGKGFYDLWLGKIPKDKKNRVHLAGVCFPQQIVESIPADEHDIKMTSIFC